MKKYQSFMAAVATFILISLACQAASLPSVSDPSGNQTPAIKVLFQDDFSKTSSGWSTYSDADGENGYKNGSYHILINKPDMYAWSVPGINLTDVAIEVDIQKKEGPEENEYGVICRYQDENNFYFLTVSSDKYFGVSKLVDGNMELIGMDQLQYKEAAIHGGANSNHLRVECVGDRLTLSANGQLLADVRDSSFQSGDVGLIAMTSETAPLDIYYDNFSVTRP